jgi:TP901 family phage tail tape measure protein
MASPFSINADLNIRDRSLAKASNDIQSRLSKLNVDTSNLKGYGYALGKITGDANEFGKSLDAASARVFAFGATAFVLNAVRDGFRKIISTTVEVEKALIDIKSVGDLTTESLIKLRKSIFEVAANTGQGFNSTAEAAGELARQGLSASENITRLTTALQISRVAGIGSAEAVKFLTATLNGYSDANLSAAVVGSKLVAVDRAAAVSAKDLSDALSRSASVANSAGVNLDELLAITTAVEQRTARGGAVIGNAFKSIFARLSRGGVIQQLQDLGVAVEKSQTGIQKLQAIANSFQTIQDSVGQNKVLELGAGVYNINILSAAIDDLRDSNSQYNKSLQDSQNAAGDLEKINNQLNTTLDSQFKRISVGFTKLASNIGDVSLKPLLDQAVDLSTKFLGFFDGLDDKSGTSFIKKLFSGIGSFITGPGTVLVSAAIVKLTLKIAEFARTGFAQLTDFSKIFAKLGGDVQQVGQQFGTLPKIISQSAPAIDTIISKERTLAGELANINQLLERQAAIRNNTSRAATSKSVYGSGTSGKASELQRLKDLYVDPQKTKTGKKVPKTQGTYTKRAFSMFSLPGKEALYPKPFLQRAYEDQTQSGNRSTSDLIRTQRSANGGPSEIEQKKNAAAFQQYTRGIIGQTASLKQFTSIKERKELQFKILKLGQQYGLSTEEIKAEQKKLLAAYKFAVQNIRGGGILPPVNLNQKKGANEGGSLRGALNAPFANTALGQKVPLNIKKFSTDGYATGAALAAPFIASIASGFAEEGSKTAKALALGGTLGAAGSFFGPIGAAFGTGLGALVSTITNSIEESFAENGKFAQFLERNAQSLSTAIEIISPLFGQIITKGIPSKDIYGLRSLATSKVGKEDPKKGALSAKFDLAQGEEQVKRTQEFYRVRGNVEKALQKETAAVRNAALKKYKENFEFDGNDIKTSRSKLQKAQEISIKEFRKLFEITSINEDGTPNVTRATSIAKPREVINKEILGKFEKVLRLGEVNSKTAVPSRDVDKIKGFLKSFDVAPVDFSQKIQKAVKGNYDKLGDAILNNIQTIIREVKASERVIKLKERQEILLLNLNKAIQSQTLNNQIASSGDVNKFDALSTIGSFDKDLLEGTKELNSAFTTISEKLNRNAVKITNKQTGQGFIRSSSNDELLKGGVFDNLTKAFQEGGAFGADKFLAKFTTLSEAERVDVLKQLESLNVVTGSYAKLGLESIKVDRQILEVNKKIAESNVKIGDKLGVLFGEKVDIASIAKITARIGELQNPTIKSSGLPKSEERRKRDDQEIFGLLQSNKDAFASFANQYGAEALDRLSKQSGVNFDEIKSRATTQARIDPIIQQGYAVAKATPGASSLESLFKDVKRSDLLTIDALDRFSQKIIDGFAKNRATSPAEVEFINFVKSFQEGLKSNIKEGGANQPTFNVSPVFDEDKQLSEERKILSINMALLNERISTATEQLNFTNIVSAVGETTKLIQDINKNISSVDNVLNSFRQMEKVTTTAMDQFTARLRDVGASTSL